MQPTFELVAKEKHVDGNQERLDVFPDKGVQFKVLPNPGLNLTHFRTTGPTGGGGGGAWVKLC